MKLLSKAFRRWMTPKQPSSVDEVAWVRSMFEGYRNGVMVDVGAHFGESSAPFSALGWQVLAFEPDPDPAKQTAIQESLNERSKLYQCALSDASSEGSVFYNSSVSSGISGLIPFHQSHREATTVEVRTLKGVLEAAAAKRIDFLKIDTEGNDLLVLKGLDWSVLPDVVLCEFEDSKTRHVGYSYRDLGEYLTGAGYRVMMSEWFPIERYGAQHRWRAAKWFPCEVSVPDAWGNFIAVKPARVADLVAALGREGISLASK
jgi:FkbM family methyltransferase